MSDEWEKTTILRKSRPTAKEAKSAAVINAAMAKGNVEITKKRKIMFSKIQLLQTKLLLIPI